MGIRWAAPFLLLFGCADLTDVKADGQCGNEVVEPSAGEDCENRSAAALGLTCGAPGTAKACRFLCTSKDNIDGTGCPDAWSCARDDTCVYLDDDLSFTTEFSFDTDEEAELLWGDVDGDARTDLVVVQRGSATVRLLDSDLELRSEQSFVTGVRTGPSLIRDLTQDGTADLVLPVASGTLLLEGGPELRLVLSPLFAADVQDLSFPDASSVYGRVTQLNAVVDNILSVSAIDNNLCFAFFNGGEMCTGDECLCVSAPNAQIDPEVGMALVERERIVNRSTVEIAYGLRGREQIFLATAVCQQNAGIEACGIGGARTIDAAGFVEGRAEFYDFNNDGIKDLWADVVQQDTFQRGLAIGFGRISGRYCPTIAGACAREGLSFVALGPMNSNGSWPEVEPILEIADLNFDTIAEVIRADGVYVGYEFTEVAAGQIRFNATRFAQPRGVNRWSDAVVADFNLDGLPDFAAVGPGAGSLDFGINPGRPFFNRDAVILPDLAKGRLVLGDFDGDLYPDVAVDSIDGVISVAFGDPQGAPTDLVRMGGFGGAIQSMVAADLPLLSDFASPNIFDKLDSATDLFVVADEDKVDGEVYQQVRTIGIILGAANRRMNSPPLFSFGDFAVSQPTLILPVADAMQLGGGLVLAARRNWVAVPAGIIGLFETSPSGVLSTMTQDLRRYEPPPGEAASCAVSSDQFEGTMIGPPSQRMLAVLEAQSTDGQVRLAGQTGPLVISLPTDASSTLRRCQRLPLAEESQMVSRPRVKSMHQIDVNQDAQVDLLVQYASDFFGPEDSPDFPGQLSGLYIYPGPFDGSRPGVPLRHSDGSTIEAIDVGDIEFDGTIEMAYSVAGQLFRSGRAVESGGEFRMQEARSLFASGMDFEPGGSFFVGGQISTSLQLADLDGDGLLELTVSNPAGTIIYGHSPCGPLRAALGECLRPAPASGGIIIDEGPDQ